MRQRNCVTYVLLITALIGCCCLAEQPTRDPYCDAFDRTVRSLGLRPAADGTGTAAKGRSLPFLVGTLGYYPLKWKTQDLLEDNHVESYAQLLRDMLVTLKETHKRLRDCGHCLDEFVGKLFYEYLPGYALHPTVTLTDHEFATRAIEFLGELGDVLEKRLHEKPPSADTDFDAFFDDVYKSVDKVWRDNDFGGLLKFANIFHLLHLASEPYVHKAIETDGQEIYRDWLKCSSDSSSTICIETEISTPTPATTTGSVATTTASGSETAVATTTAPTPTTVVTTTTATTTTTTSDKYCDALYRWYAAFAPATKKRSVRSRRSLPFFFSFGGEGALRDMVKTTLDKANIKNYRDLLYDSILVFKETHKRLVANCNHCIDHLIGTVLQEYLTGHAQSPSTTLNETQFSERLIEFIGQMGDELQRRVDKWPPSANMDFDGFWDYIYDSLDTEWQGSSDFGGFMSLSTAWGLGDTLSKDYVKRAIETEGPKIRDEILQCKRD